MPFSKCSKLLKGVYDKMSLISIAKVKKGILNKMSCF